MIFDTIFSIYSWTQILLYCDERKQSLLIVHTTNFDRMYLAKWVLTNYKNIRTPNLKMIDKYLNTRLKSKQYRIPCLFCVQYIAAKNWLSHDIRDACFLHALLTRGDLVVIRVSKLTSGERPRLGFVYRCTILKTRSFSIIKLHIAIIIIILHI